MASQREPVLVEKFYTDHAGELGYGPKQEEYGFDPEDGHSCDDSCAMHGLEG